MRRGSALWPSPQDKALIPAIQRALRSPSSAARVPRTPVACAAGWPSSASLSSRACRGPPAAGVPRLPARLFTALRAGGGAAVSPSHIRLARSRMLRKLAHVARVVVGLQAGQCLIGFSLRSGRPGRAPRRAAGCRPAPLAQGQRADREGIHPVNVWRKRPWATSAEGLVGGESGGCRRRISSVLPTRRWVPVSRTRRSSLTCIGSGMSLALVEEQRAAAGRLDQPILRALAPVKAPRS